MTSNSNAQDVFSSPGALWSSAGAWSQGAAPGASADAFVGNGAGGGAFAHVDANVTINSLAVNAASFLTIDTGSTFTATNGSTLAAGDTASLGVGNAGTINVSGGATLALGGAFVNAGAIEVGAASLADSGALKFLGAVTLSGGGHIDLGVQQGAAATTAPIDGGGLVNVDNRISGAGIITLATLDNRVGGVILANQSSDDDLTLNIAQVSNEGALEVGAGAILALGQNGQPRTIANSGQIKVGYEGGVNGTAAQLLIGGALTLSGSGALNLMGDNALVGSDQTVSSLTNAGSILATASAQIGDGGLGYDDLTFINHGSVVASGAGVVLALYTPGLDIADTGLLQAANGATLVLSSQTDLSGAGAVVQVSAGGALQALAALNDAGGAGGLVVEAGGKALLTSGVSTAAVRIDGASGVLSGGAVTVQSGARLAGPVSFASAGAVLNLSHQSAPLTVTGDGGTITLTSASVTTMGSNETISALGESGNSATLGGVGETLAGAHASFSLLAYASAALTGNDDNVTLATGSSLSVSGAGDTLSGANAAIALLAGASATLTGGGDTVTLAAGASATLTGGDDTVSLATGASLSVSGAGDAITAASGVNLTLGANAQAQISAANAVVHAGVGASFALTGTGEKLIGSGVAVSAANGSDLLIGNAGSTCAADSVSASASTIRVASNATVVISGDDDLVAARVNSIVTLEGAGDTVHYGIGATGAVGGNGVSGALDVMRGANFTGSVLANSNVRLSTLDATLSLGDGSKVEVNRTGNVITAGADVGLTVYGYANKITLGARDAVSDQGNATAFTVGGAVGAVSLTGFGTDMTAVLDLTNGVGGFADANAAFAALTGDGAGGLELSLGAAGVIDLVGASAAQLTAANFKIG